ncbi:C40 family peptidase [Sphingomonas donggukensis]|uniref:C40 family peptidase n=1 Tax=Sphingomonas donggukensis TaxID=2949093 RepID=A0ABY4TT47_9SPHN|nr:C40 family peptidase [Sphingomonas donggukensis]URW75457.1 C40 family peptidase [Sphingomonas donggukensis]
MTRGERIAAAAKAAVGARFRLHGRDLANGLDCVGLVAVAFRAGGYDGPVPTGYALRSGDGGALTEQMRAAGFARVRLMRPGDVIAMASGPGQLHLGIVTVDGFVHADAGLRRVVERPGAPPWPVVGRWRLTSKAKGDATWRR